VKADKKDIPVWISAYAVSCPAQDMYILLYPDRAAGKNDVLLFRDLIQSVNPDGES
jgi:hypothetical protein